MTDQRILEGEFFLQENKNNTQQGVLTLHADGSCRLKIFGSFDTPSPAIEHTAYCIWGQTFDGKTISMLDASRKQRVTTFGVGMTETWTAHFILLGAWVPERQVAFFNGIAAEIDGMREWIGIDGGQLTITADLSSLTYSYQKPESIIFPVYDRINGSIYFKNEMLSDANYHHRSEQFTRIQFESSEDKSFDEWRFLTRNFRNLISIFIGQKVRLNRMVLTSVHAYESQIKLTRAGEPAVKEIELIFQDPEEYTSLVSRASYFVHFEDIAPDFPNIVKNWIALIESPLAPVTELLLSAITDHNDFKENDFLRAWQGVEAFHRIIIQDTAKLKEKFYQWYDQLKAIINEKAPKLLMKLDGKMTYGYEMPATNRLMELLKANCSVLHLDAAPAQMDFWIKEMSNTRNYLTHFEPRMANKKASVQNMIYYTSLLKALLVVLTLRHLGVREELLAKTTENPIFFYRPLLKIGAP